MAKDNNLPALNKKDSLEAISKKIIKEKDPTNLKKLSQLFKITSAKKEILRIIKLTNLLDLAEDEAVKRFENNPELIENKYLISFMDTIQNSIERANRTLGLIEDTPDVLIPTVNILNVNKSDELDLQSREKIQFTVNAILTKLKEKEKDLSDSIDIEEQIILKDDEGEE